MCLLRYKVDGTALVLASNLVATYKSEAWDGGGGCPTSIV